MKAADKAIRAKGEQTRQQILDAAEELFAEGDFAAISMRDVAQQADVLLGLVSYHFKSKEALFEAVVSRRAHDINRMRLDALKAYDAPTVEQILDAFIRPPLAISNQPAWRNYMRVSARIIHQEQWDPINRRLFAPTNNQFLRALRNALPDAPAAQMERAFLYVVFVAIGITLDFRMTYRGAFSQAGANATYASALPFLSAGIHALARTKIPGKAPSIFSDPAPALPSPRKRRRPATPDSA